jgi:hypothetical protein
MTTTDTQDKCPLTWDEATALADACPIEELWLWAEGGGLPVVVVDVLVKSRNR